MQIDPLEAYKTTKATLTFEAENLMIGEKLVFLLIMGLLEKHGVITLHEVKEANLPTKISTTSSIFEKLKAKGYFTTQRSNQYFSRAYITPTEKAFLLLRSFRSLVASLR